MPRPADQFIPDGAGTKHPGLFQKALCLLNETFFESLNLFETPPLDHGALLSMRGRRERYQAFSSQMKASIRSVMIH